MKPNASRGYGDFFPFLIKVGRANAGPFFFDKKMWQENVMSSC